MRISRAATWSRVGVVGLIALASACGGEDTQTPTGGPAAGPDRRAEEIQAGYVGSDACASCHAEEHESWSGTRHAGVFRPDATPAYVGTSPAKYRNNNIIVGHTTAEGDDSRPAMRIEQGGAPGTFPVDAVIGGEHMEAYATKLADGAWAVLPLYYQVDRFAFTDFTELTCGAELIGGRAEVSGWASYDRVWNHRCIACHVTAGAIGFNPDTSEYRSTWSEPGVGCEACHGPGAAHVEAAQDGRGLEGTVNPGRLGAEGAAQVCGSCHALALPFESRWGGNLPYRPGDDFEAAFLPLLRPVEAGNFSRLTRADHTPAVGVMEYQGLARSLCALEGDATCTTCHDPHGSGVARHQLRAPTGSGDLCQDCHADVVAQGERHSRHSAERPGGACVDCHMPPTVQALGTRLASHAIDVPMPISNVDFGIDDACTQCHADRGEAWAAAAYERLWGDPETRRRRRLTRAFMENDGDALRALLANHDEAALLRMDAVYALVRGHGLAAAPAVIAALDGDPSLLVRRVAVDLLGNLGPQASAGLNEQIAQRDKMEAAGVTEALRRAAEAPSPQLRLAAAASLARLDTSDGLKRLEALRADPELERGYRLHYLLGKYHMLRQNMDAAEDDFVRVLARTPNYLPVIKDLGFIYFTTRRFQEAKDIWTRGLILDPDDEEIKLNIHLAEDQMRGETGEEVDPDHESPGAGQPES